MQPSSPWLCWLTWLVWHESSLWRGTGLSRSAILTPTCLQVCNYNSLLCAYPQYLVSRLQKVQNNAADCCHLTPPPFSFFCAGGVVEVGTGCFIVQPQAGFSDSFAYSVWLLFHLLLLLFYIFIFFMWAIFSELNIYLYNGKYMYIQLPKLSIQPSNGGQGCLLPTSCLESQGCYLIPLSYFCSHLLPSPLALSVIFQLMVYSPDFFPQNILQHFLLSDRLFCTDLVD